MDDDEQVRYVARLDDGVELTVAGDIEMSSCEVCDQLARVGWTSHASGFDATATSHMVTLCTRCGSLAMADSVDELMSRASPMVSRDRTNDLVRQLCREPAVVHVLGRAT